MSAESRKCICNADGGFALKKRVSALVGDDKRLMVEWLYNALNILDQ